ncbi:MAG: family 78 glycoside hydrolase catalytic domain [Clostridia bacterium]|nr:family 78 glycoside hydrolase catalytic domain [Clostridia bacterium]
MDNIFSASWIKAARQRKDIVIDFEKTFEAKPFPVKAELQISSLGVYSCEINGKAVTSSVLNPGWTDYNKRIQYQTYDVTSLIGKENKITVGVGIGWRFHNWYDLSSRIVSYGTVALIASLKITYENGEEVNIYTDGSWTTRENKVRYNNMYNGETVDFTYKAKKGTAATVIPYTKDTLIPQEGEYITEHEFIRGKELITTPEGDTVIDFGQELTGYLAFYCKGNKGDRIKIRHFEKLTKDGNVYTENLRSAKQELNIICDGNTHFVKPLYTFYGFRYIAVDGMEISSPDDIAAVVVHSDMKRTGYFNCSNEMINQLFHNIVWGQKGNFLDVPTDCPQRDERFGWTGDAQVFCKVASYNFNVEKFFKKWMGDLRAMQKKSGSIPSFVPIKYDDEGGSSAWADVATILPWQMYLTYGNRELLEENYTLMKKWVDFMRSWALKKKPDEGVSTDPYLYEGHWHFGDWLALDLPNKEAVEGATDKDIIGSAFFAYSTSLLIKASEELGIDCKYYKNLYKNIKRSFIKKYIDEDGKMTCNTQTACVLALHFGLYNNKEPLAQQLTDLVNSYGHLTTGFVGTPYLLHVLSDIGENELAYKLLLRDEFPSWCYPITQGATTMWERWNGYKPDGTFATAEMNSFNHYAYGAVGDWMYEKMCGITQREGSAGFTDIIFSPIVGNDFTFAEASIETRNGKIASRWEKTDDGILYTFTVPEKTNAQALLNGKKYVLNTGINKFTV